MTSPGGIEKTHLRGSIYGVLAQAFSKPKDEGEKLYAAMLEAGGTLGLSETFDLQKPSALNAHLVDLSREHLRLFVGPGHISCPPYESAVRKDRPKLQRGLVMGPSTADVRRMYKAAGLDMSSNYTDLPDHIAAEMEFMQFLCAEESKFTREGKDAETKKVQTMERDFLNNHIEPWVSEFADCVLSKTNSQFYKLAANLLKTFTKNELNQFAEGGTR